VCDFLSIIYRYSDSTTNQIVRELRPKGLNEGKNKVIQDGTLSTVEKINFMRQLKSNKFKHQTVCENDKQQTNTKTNDN